MASLDTCLLSFLEGFLRGSFLHSLFFLDDHTVAEPMDVALEALETDFAAGVLHLYLQKDFFVRFSFDDSKLVGTEALKLILYCIDALGEVLQVVPILRNLMLLLLPVELLLLYLKEG